MKRSRPICRRLFLQGAGGVTLGLPFLPSLATRQAHAQDAVIPRQPHFFMLATDHGGVFDANMFPAPSLLTQTAPVVTGHTARFGMMQANAAGLSPVLKGAALTQKLVGKMNVLHGIDVPWYLSHNTGMHLGNFARNDGNGNDGKMAQGSPRPTIDQLMAWSSSFYPNLTGIKERVLVMGDRDISWGYANPSAQSGGIQAVSRTNSSKTLFDKIFVPTTGGTPTPPPPVRRKAIADAVLANYKRLHDGNQRISREDKIRLSNHMSLIAELQRKVNDTGAPPAQPTLSCGSIVKATDDSTRHGASNAAEYAKYGQLFNDVVVAAFACGSSRLATFALASQEKAVSFTGSWHQDTAHKWNEAGAQDRLKTAYQIVFERIYLDLAVKLDSFESAPGRTMLDDTLMVWSQECGQETHMQISVPIVTFGSAAGHFKTGMYVDYGRNTNPGSMIAYTQGGSSQHMGLTYNQWLANILLAMRMPPAQWEKWGHKGYGFPYVTPEGWMPGAMRTHYQNTSSQYFTMASNPLPVITA